LHWWSYALVAIHTPVWWIAAAAPVIMLVFILFVTGIPPTEARAIASRGEDYREYQRTTSAFVPWFPKKASKKP
jgi:steroid 5-alpha reductase family enzyme